MTWATRLCDLTIEQFVNLGVLDSETSKILPPKNLRVVLSEEDIDKIVKRLRNSKV